MGSVGQHHRWEHAGQRFFELAHRCDRVDQLGLQTAGTVDRCSSACASHPSSSTATVPLDPASGPMMNVLSFAIRGQVRVLRIEALPVRRGPPAEARALYTDLADPVATASADRAEAPGEAPLTREAGGD